MRHTSNDDEFRSCNSSLLVFFSNLLSLLPIKVIRAGKENVMHITNLVDFWWLLLPEFDTADVQGALEQVGLRPGNTRYRLPTASKTRYVDTVNIDCVVLRNISRRKYCL